ncbi:unnamed protein product, partial [Staurois parvus]
MSSEVPCHCRGGRGVTTGRFAASRELIAGQLSALPHLLKLGAPVLEPDLHL